MIKLMTASAVFLCLTACTISPLGKVTSGGAIYKYVKTPEGGCSVEITSARTISGGQIEIDENCKLTTTADEAGGAREALNKIADIVTQVMP